MRIVEPRKVQVQNFFVVLAWKLYMKEAAVILELHYEVFHPSTRIYSGLQ